jgi:hypothetical protein
MTTESMLSTIDNPYNPFTHFDEWLAFDNRHGYATLSLLARVAVVSLETSEAELDRSIEEAIDEIVRENVSGMHIKVTKELDG